MPNGPLDMSLCEEGDVDEDIQLEITNYQSNPKFANLPDYAFDGEIKKFKGYLQDLNLKEPSKLEKQIQDLQREQRFRQRRQKTGCSGRRSKALASNGRAFSEDVAIVKGKEPLAHLPLNTEGSTFYKRKDKSRIQSGDLAGPSPRHGLRSGAKSCSDCDRKLLLTNDCHGSDDGIDDLFCSSCQRKQKCMYLSSTKESSKKVSPPGIASGRKGNGGKRARQAVGGGDSPEKVVELFSSEDEEDKETRYTFADCEVSNQRTVHGTCSTPVPRMEGLKIAYPSRDDPEAVEVHYRDLHRLQPLEFLNDTVIDFYINYMQRPEVLTVEHKSKFHFFNSFFYKKLSEIVNAQNKKHVADLSKLRKWTKGTNIFEKDYLFVPIHDKWHWSLAIICHPGATSEDIGSQRCILHLDSMSPGHKSNTVFRLLRTYLLVEWGHQKDEDGVGNLYQNVCFENLTTKKVLVPQQENESDCGLFLLHYIELFLKEAPSSFKLSDIEQGKMFGRNWFKPSQASDLRKGILELLQDFFNAEAAKATENTETIERFSSQHQPSENLLQENRDQANHADGEDERVMEVTEAVQSRSDSENLSQENRHQVNHADAEDERVMEVTESVRSPSQSSVTRPEHEPNVLDTQLTSFHCSSDGSTPEGLQVEHAQQNLDNNVVDIGGDSRACCRAISADAESLSGLTGGARSRSTDLESLVELAARNKCQRVESPDDSKEMDILQINSHNRDLGDDNQGELCLVVELPIQKEQCLNDSSLQLAAGLASGEMGDTKVENNGHDGPGKMDCS